MPATVAPVMIPVAGAAFVRPITAGNGLRLYGATSGYVGLKPAAAAGSIDITLPATLPVSNGQALIGNADGTTSWTTISGGLTKFTEAETTSSPNGTVYVDSITAAGSSTNVDFAIIPKAAGAIITAVPDSASTGGNKRGARAVDLQLERSSASHVASGPGSTLSGGSQNLVSGQYAVCGGGAANSVSGNNATVPGGIYNTAAGANSIATGTRASSPLHGQRAHSAGYFSANGDSQVFDLVLRGTSTNGTVNGTTLYLDGSSAKPTLPASTSWACKLVVLARSSANHAMWTFDFLINRDGSNNTSIPNMTMNSPILVDYSGGIGSWNISVTADDTNECPKVQVTGEDGVNIKWTAWLFVVQITG